MDVGVGAIAADLRSAAASRARPSETAGAQVERVDGRQLAAKDGPEPGTHMAAESSKKPHTCANKHRTDGSAVGGILWKSTPHKKKKKGPLMSRQLGST